MVDGWWFDVRMRNGAKQETVSNMKWQTVKNGLTICVLVVISWEEEREAKTKCNRKVRAVEGAARKKKTIIKRTAVKKKMHKKVKTVKAVKKKIIWEFKTERTSQQKHKGAAEKKCHAVRIPNQFFVLN